MLAELGSTGEARAELEALAADGFGRLPFDEEWQLSMCFLAEAAAQLNDTAGAETLCRLPAPLCRQGRYQPVPCRRGRHAVVASLELVGVPVPRHDPKPPECACLTRSAPRALQHQVRRQPVEPRERALVHRAEAPALFERDQEDLSRELVGAFDRRPGPPVRDPLRALRQRHRDRNRPVAELRLRGDQHLGTLCHRQRRQPVGTEQLGYARALRGRLPVTASGGACRQTCADRAASFRALARGSSGRRVVGEPTGRTRTSAN
jgi:hypothetical protein